MTGNENRILADATTALKRTTGIDAQVRRAKTDHVIIGLVCKQGKYRFQVEVKAVDRFETAAMIKALGKTYREPPLLVAPYITSEVAERCRQLQLSFIDTAGNAHLEGPGLFVYVIGNRRPTGLHQDHFRALNPAGLKIAFALACQPSLAQANYRDIAARAGVALGTVGPVMKDLEARGYLRSQTKSNRSLVNLESMVEEWATHYPVALRPKLNVRRFRAETERLQHADMTQYNAYWGGEAAAEKLTRYLKPAQFTIYARDPITKMLAAMRMRSDAGGNVEVLDAFWNFDRDKAFPDVVPPILAYADLLATHDGRDAEAAKLIYEQRIAPAFRPGK